MSAFAQRTKGLSARAYVAIAVVAVLVGIAVNALVLQRERHPAPLFPPAAPATPAASPATGSAPASQSAGAAGGVSAPAPSPPLPPSVRPALAADASSTQRPPDPIADLLRSEPRAEGARLILAAQTALIKLGYAVKPDGNEGSATQEALRDFERTRGLPVATEISPRLVRQLESAARRAAH